MGVEGWNLAKGEELACDEGVPPLHPCKEGAAILPGENGSRATRPPLRTNSTQLIGYRVRSRDVGTTLKSRQFPSAAFHKGPSPT